MPSRNNNSYNDRRLSSSQSSPLKWIVIGALGTIGFLIVLVISLLFFFTPLLKIDESTGRIQLLGGAFDIQAKNVITRLSKEGSFVFGSMEGVRVLSPTIKSVEVQFGSGEVRIDYNSSEEINWDCDGAGKSAKADVLEKDEKMVLDFSSALVDCDISVPQKNLKISAILGDIVVKAPPRDLSIKLEKGNVELFPDPQIAYVYNLKATKGDTEDFESSKDATAVRIDVEVTNGEIIKLD